MDPYRSPSFPPNSSPKLQWGSPALRPIASYPPNRVTASQGQGISTPPPRQSAFMDRGGIRHVFESPQFMRTYSNTFRTPQPNRTHIQSSPTALQPPWTDSRGLQKKIFPMSPRGNAFGSPSVNPGGSDDISQYYHQSMVEDPWLDIQPRPVNHWENK